MRKGFEVEATGDVVVLQNAEPCRIKAGRDVFIHGGVLGGGKGEYRIEAGRDITAGYAENAWLEAQGDIRIEDFALQSFLYSGGRILLDKRRGSLIGGEAVAARGLEARSLGSQTEVRTLVAVGVDFVVKRNLLQLTRHHQELQEAALKVDRMLKSLVELCGPRDPPSFQGGNPPHHRREAQAHGQDPARREDAHRRTERRPGKRRPGGHPGLRGRLPRSDRGHPRAPLQG